MPALQPDLPAAGLARALFRQFRPWRSCNTEVFDHFFFSGKPGRMSGSPLRTISSDLVTSLPVQWNAVFLNKADVAVGAAVSARLLPLFVPSLFPRQADLTGLLFLFPARDSAA